MLSLYRRHRPRSFADVVGQEHIVRTLRNAIELGKVHHAYLFVGSRGTGKTSMAKLLACALNAEGGPRADFSADDPACGAIASGTSLDVVEMDAASNNSVDDIRELRENVALQPMGGGRRVYILDEAHMLTTSAWNAFLKTLEEPPPHVVFVLATTEAHKVPATIVDRCHRFDFHRPSLDQLAGVLRRVAAEESIEVPDAAVGMIARAATGSFRDALGTLEQLVTYGGARIELADVLEVLGVADAELVLEAAESLADHSSRDALLCIERLAASGRDLSQFMRDLAAHFRHLFVTQTLGEVPETFSVTAEHTDRIAAQADRISQGELLRAIDLLAAAVGAVKEGSDPRIQLELALTKAVRPDVDLSIGALAFRLEQLEARVGELSETAPRPLAGSEAVGSPAVRAVETGPSESANAGREDASPGPPGLSAVPSGENGAGARAPAPVDASAADERDSTARAVSEPTALRGSAGEPSSDAAAGSSNGAGTSSSLSGPTPASPSPPAPAPTPPPASATMSVPALPTPKSGTAPTAAPAPTAAFAPTSAPPTNPPDSPRVAPELPSTASPEVPSIAGDTAAPTLDLPALRTLWPSVVDAIRAENAMVGALLGEARPTGLGDDGLTVAFPPSGGFSKRKAEGNRTLIQDTVRRLTGRGLSLRFELAEIAAESELAPAGAPVLSEDELLDRLKQEFGAREIFEDETPARED